MSILLKLAKKFEMRIKLADVPEPTTGQDMLIDWVNQNISKQDCKNIINSFINDDKTQIGSKVLTDFDFKGLEVVTDTNSGKPSHIITVKSDGTPEENKLIEQVFLSKITTFFDSKVKSAKTPPPKGKTNNWLATK